MRRFISLSLAVVALAVFTAGCGERSKINLAGLAENPPGSMNELGGANNGNNGRGQNADDPADPLIIDNPNPDDTTIGGLDPNQPAAWANTEAGIVTENDFVKNGTYWNEKVYFDYNRYEVRPAERAKLDKLAEYLTANPQYKVVIEGHCDERGSDEYNRGLSERRALSIQTYLTNLGIDATRMKTVSYGEDRLLIPNATTDAQHQQNRRAEFLVGEGK